VKKGKSGKKVEEEEGRAEGMPTRVGERISEAA